MSTYIVALVTLSTAAPDYCLLSYDAMAAASRMVINPSGNVGSLFQLTEPQLSCLALNSRALSLA